MAVNWQSIEIPFGGGINTKTNPRRLQPPQLEDLQNLVFTDAPGYKARYGSTQITAAAELLGSNTSITAGQKLMTHGDQLLLYNGSELYTYDTIEPRWIDIHSSLPLPEVTEKVAAQSISRQRFASSAKLNNVRLSAWRNQDDDDDWFYSIENAVTGYPFFQTSLGDYDDRFQVRCIASVSNLYMFCTDTVLGELRYFKVDPTDPAAGVTGGGVLRSTASTDGVMHCCSDPTDANNIIVVYKESSTSVQSFIFDASTDTAASNVQAISGATDADVSFIRCQANQTYVFTMGMVAGGPVHLHRQDLADLANATKLDEVNVAADVVSLCVDPAGSGNWNDTTNPNTFLWSTGDGDYNSITYFSHRGAAFSSANTIPNTGIATTGFTYDSTNIVGLIYDSDNAGTDPGAQSTYLFYGFYPGFAANFNPIARIAPGSAVLHAWVADPDNTGTNEWEIPLSYQTQVDTDTDDGIFNRPQVVYVTLGFDVSHTNRLQSVEAGGATYFNGGGTVWTYDGKDIDHNGTWLYPEYISVSETTGGNLTTNSTYNYRVYYEKYNRAGERTRSTYARAYEATMNSTNTAVDFTVPTLPAYITPADNVLITIYRSEADADVASGAPFYRVTSLDPTATGVNGSLQNASSATVTFTDELADSALTNNELDYQNTGELDNVPAPVGSYLAQAKNRLWVTGGLDGNRAYYSKLRLPGDTVAFNETLTIQLPDDNDPDGITAIAELNHFVVFFKNESIYVISGDGPDNLGRGYFNEPQRVTSDVGCSEPRSVVAYDGGLLFKSDKGIYRLGQNLQVDYLGAPVEAYNSQDITAATLVNDQNQIRFLTSSGRMLVYDYLVGQWTTFTGWTGVSAVNWRNGDLYSWLESSGAVHHENQATFEDNGAPVDTSFTTAPITLQGLGGFYRMQRVHFTGDYSTLTNFEVTPYYDGASSGTEASVLTSALDTTNPFNVVFNMPRQKFSDVKFKVTLDKSNSGTSEGVTIQSMRAKVAYKPGLNKLSDGNKFGS